MLGKGRRAQLERIRRNEAGEYAYTGPLYRYAGPRGRFLAVLWGLCGAAAVCLVIGGVLPIPGAMDVFWILLPYCGSVVCCGMCLLSLAEVTASGDMLRQNARLQQQRAVQTVHEITLADRHFGLIIGRKHLVNPEIFALNQTADHGRPFKFEDHMASCKVNIDHVIALAADNLGHFA